MTMSTAIELLNVSKTFDLVTEKHSSIKAAVLSFRRPPRHRLLALHDVTLSIQQGETVAIIGKNGSGKSTLLRIVGRVYKPSSGRVHTVGRMSTMLDPGAGFHPDLTGRENVFFNAAIMGLSAQHIRAKLDSIFAFAELDQFIDAPVKTYSEGMLMRLGFSIAIETEPDILLIDESLGVGDIDFQAKCYERITKFGRSGGTIVFSTHDLPAARAVAPRAVWLQRGEVHFDGETNKAVDAYLDSLPHHERPLET